MFWRYDELTKLHDSKLENFRNILLRYLEKNHSNVIPMVQYDFLNKGNTTF
jgi:hypothetical protein